MFELIQQRRRQPREDQSITVNGFPRGLNTYDAFRAVRKDELTSALNYYLNRRGDLVPRPGLVRVTTAQLDGNAVSCEKLRIGSDIVDIICTSTNKVYKLMADGTPTLLGTLTGQGCPFAYGDYCVICDGSYLKYIGPDGILAMAFDAGEDNELYDKIDETSDGEIAIYAGQVRAGVKFTFPTFADGFKIPMTDLKARVKAVGSPTGSLTARLYSGTTLLATANESIDVSTLLTTEQTVNFTFPFDVTDQAGWMESNTEYRAVLVYGGGNATNHVALRTVSSASEGTNYTTTWVDSLDSPLMWLAPNLPPKASFGKTTLNRPFLGGDPDNPGWLWYGNLGIFDWSTPNGGGWVGVIDDSETSYPIGGIGVLYGELYAFGTEARPYLSKLTGDSPLAYQLLDSFKAVAASHKTIVDQPNDVWYSRPSGTNNITGVDSYGSTRTRSQAAPVINSFDKYWDDANVNFAGFYEKLRLYMLYIESSDTVLVCHIDIPYQRSSVATDIGHPWTEFKFPTKPTMLDSGKADFLVGLTDGHVYRFDYETLDDAGTEIEFNWRTAFIDIPFVNVDLNLLHVLGASQGGLATTINIYTETNHIDIVRSINVNLGQTGLLVQAATMLVQDADFLVQRGSMPPVFPLNIRCSTVQLEGAGLTRYFYEPAVLSGGLLKYKTLEM